MSPRAYVACRRLVVGFVGAREGQLQLAVGVPFRRSHHDLPNKAHCVFWVAFIKASHGQFIGWVARQLLHISDSSSC